MTTNSKILIVEDDANLAKNLADAFTEEQFQAVTATNSESAKTFLEAGDVSLVILDRMLGGEDGFDIIRWIRRSNPVLPIIMLTGRTGEIDRVSGLEVGADDYVLKPFSLAELIARVRVQLRKRSHAGSDAELSHEIFEFEKIVLDADTRRVTLDGTEVELTRQEFDLLLYFARNPLKALPREQLLENVWSDFSPYDVRAVDSSVKRLREKLDSEATKEGLIGTLRGVGYRLNATVTKRR